MKLEKKKALSDKEILIQKWEGRIKYHRRQLAETRKFHREVEKGILKKIGLEVMQLKALKKK